MAETTKIRRRLKIAGFAIFAGLGVMSGLAGSGLAWADPDKSTKVIPLPVYATLPNEGSTWGLMPVFLIYDNESQRTTDILAPSVSWNRVIRYTGTFRWYKYPSSNESYQLIASGSTHVNWGTVFTYDRLPPEINALTHQVYLRVQRSIFYRFFGIGPFTPVGDETSHTRVKGDFRYRVGTNFATNWNLGARVGIARDLVQSIAASNLPLSTERFPTAPGMSGATIVTEGLDLRYDSRKDQDYSTTGTYVDLSASAVQGISSSPDYGSFLLEVRRLFEEGDGLQLGTRFLTSYVTSKDVPFYHQSALGGSFVMRGFQEDRFIDQGAWTLELEERIRAFQLHIYGVTSDWRIDPFFSMGQVFGADENPFSKVRYAGGVGFRAWVRPNVLGRVDVGYADEGLKFYVELGYPF